MNDNTIIELLNRKQMLLKSFKTFIVGTKQDTNVYSVQTDVSKSYWLHKGIIYNSNIFNLSAAAKIKKTLLPKDTVFYVSTIQEQRKHLFNI